MSDPTDHDVLVPGVYPPGDAPHQDAPQHHGPADGVAGTWTSTTQRLPSAPPVDEPPLVPPTPTGWPALDVPPAESVSARRAAMLGGVVGCIVAALLAAVLWVTVGDDDSGSSTTDTPSSIVAPGGTEFDIQAVLAKVQTSVVSIETSRENIGGVFSGAGTGIVLTADGLVLTNAHVVGASSTIQVTLSDGTTKDATLVGSVPQDDLAVIRVEGVDDLVPAELGTSSELNVGDPVVAIGNALNLGGPPSVTLGIVSAKDRTIEAPGVTLQGLVQTDAAINPGNSGGPLVNAAGQVVGVNTAIVEDSQNIGFAIAIDLARPIIDQIENGEGTITPNTAYLGVATTTVADLLPQLRVSAGIEAEDGAFVSEVVPGEAADKAGIRVGDVLLRIGDRDISSSEEVGEAVLDHAPGDRVEIVLERNGDEQRITVTLGDRG